MKIRNAIKRLGISFVHQACRLPVQKYSLVTARGGNSARVTRGKSGPPDAAPATRSQGKFENLSSSSGAVNIIQPEKSKDGSTGRLIYLLTGDCDEGSTKFLLQTRTNLGYYVTELDICVFAVQLDWPSGHSKAANNTPGNIESLPCDNVGAVNDFVESSCSARDEKQYSPDGRTVPDSTDPDVTATAQEEARAHSDTSRSSTPYAGGGTVIMRVPPVPASSSSRLGSCSSFKAENSSSSLNSGNEGEGTNSQGDKQKPQCHLCGLSFTRRNDLTRHLVNVHGDKGYVCPSCGSQLSRPDAVKRHEDSGACAKRSSRQSGQGSGKS